MRGEEMQKQAKWAIACPRPKGRNAQTPPLLKVPHMSLQEGLRTRRTACVGGERVINRGREWPGVHSPHKSERVSVCARGHPIWPCLYLVPDVELLVLSPG